MNTHLVVRPLEPQDAGAVTNFLTAQPEDYVRFFYALRAEEAEIASLLAAAERDYFGGVFWAGDLICIFMLRGWDEGYEIPSFGLVVSATRQGREVLSVALESAKLIARLAGCDRMMCKVHPDNQAATRGALKNGFAPDREEAGSGNVIYFLAL